MGLFNVFKGFKKDRRQFVQTSEIARYLWANPQYNITDYLNSYTGWVFAAVNVISNSIAKVRWELAQEKPDGSIEPVLRHPVLSILQKPNPLSTRWEMMKLTDIHLELTGNAFWYLAMNSLGKPAEIWVIPPDRMRVVPSEDGLIKGYLYEFAGQTIAFEPAEIIHFKFPHPTNRYYGMGVLQAVVYEYDTDLFMRKYQLSLFKNRAIPDVLLITDRVLNKEEEDRLRAKWESAYRGIDRSGKVAVISKSLQVQPLGLTPKDIEFLEGRRFTRDTILHVWGVPPSKLGVVEDVNRANAEANDYTFQNEVILPRLELIQQVLQYDFIDVFWESDSLTIDFENPVPQDKEYRLRQHQTYLNNGVMTINEVREEVGLEPVDWGDVVYMPFNLYPVSGSRRNEPQEEPVSEEMFRTQTVIPHSSYPQEVQREQIWKLFIAQTNPLENLMIRRTRQLFKQQEKEVIENLYRIKSFFGTQQKQNDDLVEFIIFDRYTWDRIFSEETIDIFTEAYGAGIDRAIALMGITFDYTVDNPRAVELIRNKNMRFAEQVNNTTIEQLKEELIAGFQNGESIEKLAERVKTVFEYATKSRCLTIARTEVIGATNAGITDTYRLSGVVEYKEWLTARDEKVRPEHIAADGQIVKIDEMFTVGGEVLKFPGDPNGSPGNIVNCRCTVLPVLEREGET